MTINEFDIIRNFFTKQSVHRPDVILGVGDDCAITQVPAEYNLAITTDTLVEGIHFLKNTTAFDIGFKALAVNLSDLAAIGAKPTWITLALTLPEANEIWLNEFSRGMLELANRYEVQLIGGDLTRGPLTITIQAHGFLPKNQALRRDAAKPGDLIYVTNTLGDAALALLFLCDKVTLEKKYQEYLLNRLHRPEPCVHIGERIRGIAHAAIDISDGLTADLEHILKNSHVGATIYVDQLPLSEAMRASIPEEQAFALALNGGDDYELCFTISPNQKKNLDFKCTCIGKINEILGLDLRFRKEKKYNGVPKGYQHF